MRRAFAVAVLLLAANGCKKNVACRPGTLFLSFELDGAAGGADELHIALTDDMGTLNADAPYHGGSSLQIDFPSGRYGAGKSVTLVVSALAAGVELASIEKDGFVLPASCASVKITLGLSADASVGDLSNTLPPGDLAGADLSGGPDLAKLGNSAACGQNSDCASMFCVDGVCCNALCDGQCEACDVDTFVGQCVPVVSGQPHGTRTACLGAGTMCVGTCSPAARNACTYPGPATTCSPQTCVGSTLTLASGCDRNGGCATPQTLTCPMDCVGGGNTCMGACTDDASCSGTPATPFCDNGVCTPLRPRGHSCSAAVDCTSGSCADGVCCTNDCKGQCQSCNEAGSVGTCIRITGAVRMASPPPTRAGCSGTDGCVGSCNGTADDCVLPGSSTMCGMQSCAGTGVKTPVGSCNNGMCNQIMSQCNTNICNPGGTDCGTCGNDGDCGAGKWCNTGLNGGTCLVKGADGATGCLANNQCANNACAQNGICCHVACSGGTSGCTANGTACTCFGGSCGSQVCLANGSCCAPNCAGKNCGSDGCGGDCGSCSTSCNGGTCCVPKCGSSNCGDDGCGGSCGTCTPSNTCCNTVVGGVDINKCVKPIDCG